MTSLIIFKAKVLPSKLKGKVLFRHTDRRIFWIKEVSTLNNIYIYIYIIYIYDSQIVHHNPCFDLFILILFFYVSTYCLLQKFIYIKM